MINIHVYSHRPQNKTKTNKNLIKFVLTKNPELLFKSENKLKPKSKAFSENSKVNSRSFNVDIKNHQECYRSD